MKFGRLRLKVRKIHFANKPKTVNPINKGINVNDNSSKLCRICYTNEPSSPLISPCNCTGSLRYVHLTCLQKWIMSKVQLSINEKKTCFKYTLNPVQCEICKTFLPDYYKKDNLLYEICEYPTSYINFISLETILCGKYNTKVIYVINLDAEHQDLFTIGRDRNCDLCVSDITISRLHAGLFVENERIYLRDEGAKFGTSVLVQNKKFRLANNKGISFQFGKSIVTVVQRPGMIQNLFCMCFGKEDNFLYWEENRKGIDFEKDYLIKEDKANNDDTVEEDKNVLNTNKDKTGFVEIEVAKEDNDELKHKQTELYVD